MLSIKFILKDTSKDSSLNYMYVFSGRKRPFKYSLSEVVPIKYWNKESQRARVLLKKVYEKDFIEWGRDYVIDTTNGPVFKRLAPSERDGYVKCVSLNDSPIYATFEVSYNEIFGIYRVLMCLSDK
ncbi:MAG: Uncharacterized protein H6Q15_2208 [Bacteroidetes bacterium]|nr:Uncharacterized protein [Bacteroidota bacterium]